MDGILLAGPGGAAGAAGRYLIGLLPAKTSFPILTLCINFVLIGFVSGAFARKRMREKGILFWKTGMCDGFTAFSSPLCVNSLAL